MTTSRGIWRVLQLDRGRIRTLLIAAACLVGRATWKSLALGYVLVLPGTALHLAAKGTLRIGHEVTTSGPYRWVRNPFYLATLLVDAGVCVVAHDGWFAACAMAVSVAIHVHTILGEERALERMFGAAYTEYRDRVPWLLPWKGPVRGLSPSVGFSWTNQQLVKGVEYARLVRTIAAPLLVFVGARLIVLRGSFFSMQHRGEVAASAVLVALLVADRLLVRRSRALKQAAAS